MTMTPEHAMMATGGGETASAQAILTVRDLKVWFELRRFGFGHAGYVRAVDGASFEVGAGHAIAVVGESGCGKSTLMKTILGLNRPTAGEVVFDGTRLNDLSRSGIGAYRAQVGYVQQDPYGALPPFMSVQRALQEPLIVNGIRREAEQRERIHKVLEEVKLTPISEILPKYPHMLSGGQQQRVVIARAMILEPRLLVADEPVSMLDASVRVEILSLMRALQQEHHLAVVYVTHDLSTVRYFSERIMVMYAGQIIEQGGVDEVVRNPLHFYTQALIDATADPDARNAEVCREVPPGEPPSLVRPPAGCRFHPRCPARIDGLCEMQEPPEFEPEAGHIAACWRYK